MPICRMWPHVYLDLAQGRRYRQWALREVSTDSVQPTHVHNHNTCFTKISALSLSCWPLIWYRLIAVQGLTRRKLLSNSADSGVHLRIDTSWIQIVDFLMNSSGCAIAQQLPPHAGPYLSTILLLHNNIVAQKGRGWLTRIRGAFHQTPIATRSHIAKHKYD